MNDRTEKIDGDRVATLTATVDQLQAEVDRHATVVALLVGVALATCILVVMLEVKYRRLSQ